MDSLFYRVLSNPFFLLVTCVAARRISEVFKLFCGPFRDAGCVVLSACDFGRLLPATWNRGEPFVCRDLNGHSAHRFAAAVGLGPRMRIPFNPGRLARPTGRAKQPRHPFRPYRDNRRQAARRWSAGMFSCCPPGLGLLKDTSLLAAHRFGDRFRSLPTSMNPGTAY
jgi:hypothetical protein